MGLLWSWSRRQSAHHICSVSKGSESHLPRLPPNAAFSANFKRRLQKILLVADNHPYTRIYLRSKAAIAFEKRRHGISAYWWLVHPCSMFRFIWDFFMAIIFLYLFIMIPYTLSFLRIPKENNAVSDIILMLTPAYAICLIDIFINCITGYVSDDRHEIFIDPLLIVRHYFRRFFFIDLISSIPYIWFYQERIEEPGPNVNIYLLFLELIPLLKFFRLPTLRKYVKQIIVTFGASRIYQHGIWIFILTVLIFHWAACFTYAVPIVYAYWVKVPKEEAKGFLFKRKLYDEPTWFIYVTCLHMGGGNLCSYSYTEFEFMDIPDKVARCVLLIFGMAYFLYAIVVVLQLVSSSAEPELKYQSIMHGVRDYIRKKKLTKKLRERLLHFYEHRFQGSLFKEKAITATLSKHLKNEITQHSSRILLESTPLFNEISRSLLNNIIGALKQVIFLQDDVIYKCDTHGKCMYFIITGTVALISYTGKVLCHVKDGEYFGEISLFQHEHKRKLTAIALEVCEVLRLNRRAFNRLVPVTSEFYKRLQSAAHQRLLDLSKIDDQTSVDEIFPQQFVYMRSNYNNNDDNARPAGNENLNMQDDDYDDDDD